MIAVTETWATENINDCELLIDGYVLYRKDRHSDIHMRGGGVMIMVKDTLNSKPLLQLNSSRFQESVWCQIDQDNLKLVLGVCYRSTASTSENDKELFNLLRRVTSIPLGTQIMVLGDFNYPDIDYITVDHGFGHGVGSEASRFLDVVRDTGFYQHVREFTRYREGQNPSLLDYVFTDNECVIDNLQCKSPLGKSDHVCIEFEYLTQHHNQPSLQRKLNYWKADYRSIRKELGNIDWEAELTGRNVSDCWHLLHDKLMQLTEEFVPRKTTSNTSKKSNSGITKSSIKEIKKRERAWARYKAAGSDDSWRAYKIIRNRVTSLIRNDKEVHQRKLIQGFKDKPKRFYGYMRRSRAVKTVISGIETANGKQTESDKQAADELCHYFSKVFVHEGAWDGGGIGDLSDDGTQWTIEVTENEVFKALSKLKPDKSAGPDDIHPAILREAAAELTKPLTILFQKSLSEGNLPEVWNKGNITPIHKKGPRNEAGNYRPVSLTSVVCKLLESIIRDHMLNYFNNTVITEFQHGFVRGRSCLTNLLEVFEHWTSSMDEGYGVDVIYLDYRKAFDTVPHKRLLMKLKMLGIRGNVLKCIANFLQNRMMRVIVNGECSDWVYVLSGIPQGSVLGPLLFLIFVNDLPDWIKTNIRMFADDTKIWTKIVTEEDVAKLQDDLNSLCEWSRKWLLQFNPEKCVVMHIGHNMDSRYYLSQGGQNCELKSVTEEKDLGVLATSKLKVSQQCVQAACKASKVVGMIRRQFPVLDKHSFMILYKGFVRPHLEYAIQAWSPYLRKDIECLERVQRKATKLVQGLKKLSYVERLERLHLTTLEKRRLRGDLIETYKLLTGRENIDCNSPLHLDDSHYNTRGHRSQAQETRITSGCFGRISSVMELSRNGS